MSGEEQPGSYGAKKIKMNGDKMAKKKLMKQILLPPLQKEPKQTLCLRITQSVAEIIRLKAKKTGRPICVEVEDAIKQYLEVKK
jgi:hypothetical protein